MFERIGGARVVVEVTPSTVCVQSLGYHYQG